jgi:SOS regulatory protein LexA
MAETTKKAKKNGNVRKLILYSIINYMEKNDGRSPTLREIGDDVGIRSLGHISYHLKGLEETYYIERDDHKSRCIRVLKNWNGSSFTNPVAIAAGPKRIIMSAIVKEDQLFSNKVFLLPVEGNSMIGDSIFNGDLLIVDPEEHIKDGDIVVATHLDYAESELGAATVKHLYRDEERKKIRLQPSNSEMSPLYIDSNQWNNEWQVQGKVIGVIHQFA